MILIQTTESDLSTNDVLDWIYHINPIQKVIRLNGKSIISSISIGADISIEINGKSIFLSEVKSVWYRRGEFSLAENESSEDFSLHILAYAQTVISGSHYFSAANTIGKFSDNTKNKINNIIAARHHGLKVPHSLFTNTLKAIEKIDSHHVITKGLANDTIKLIFNDNEECCLNLINSVFPKDSLNKKDNSSVTIPSFFQEYIEKKYELRIFYLKGEFFCMAIFSQQNEKTRLDFRNYDMEKPNRNVPFNLPKEIEYKLDKLMQAIDMDCGSIDMIYTPTGEYVFLEVNPVGQYQWVERYCNYPLSKRIAEILTS